MKCPYCISDITKVTDTRHGKGFTRRRRECLDCSKRFTTYERVEKAGMIVIKKDGRKEPFSFDKLKMGITKACEKRPISEQKIDAISKQIERKIRDSPSIEIETKKIGNLVMRKLKKLDEVAYMRFASVYREFGDLYAFEKELKALTSTKTGR